MDHELLHRLREKGYADFECKNVVYGESVKEVRGPVWPRAAGLD